jgi:hypothetical protein
MRIRSLLLAALMLGAACEPAPPRSQFGVYPRYTLQLRLTSGETFTVYRVKHWTFRDGAPPALQLEYEPPFSVQDTAGLRRLARQIWPAFAPYVEKLGLASAILTATNLEKHGNSLVHTERIRSFGLIARRDSAGVWRLERDPVPLPPAETGGQPRIFGASGDPLLLNFPQPDRATRP